MNKQLLQSKVLYTSYISYFKFIFSLKYLFLCLKFSSLLIIVKFTKNIWDLPDNLVQLISTNLQLCSDPKKNALHNKLTPQNPHEAQFIFYRLFDYLNFSFTDNVLQEFSIPQPFNQIRQNRKIMLFFNICSLKLVIQFSSVLSFAGMNNRCSWLFHHIWISHCLKIFNFDYICHRSWNIIRCGCASNEAVSLFNLSLHYFTYSFVSLLNTPKKKNPGNSNQEWENNSMS